MPVACPYKVTLGWRATDDEDDLPVMPTGACSSCTVVAKDAEAAVARAHKHLAAEGALYRHLGGDWGDVSKVDSQANDAALKVGARLLSVYVFGGGRQLWVLTEAADASGVRAETTLLRPEEY
jgi:hypothetical protein